MRGDCNICINGKLPSYSASCVECGLLRKNYKPITNADRIRGMTDEELEKKIAALMACMECPLLEMCERAEPRRCIDMWLDWLKAPVEEAE